MKRAFFVIGSKRVKISRADEWIRNETGDYPPQRGYRYISGALLIMLLSVLHC